MSLVFAFILFSFFGWLVFWGWGLGFFVFFFCFFVFCFLQLVKFGSQYLICIHSAVNQQKLDTGCMQVKHLAQYH